jgi:hypothetical protein
MAGYRLIALAIAFLAGAVLVGAGASADQYNKGIQIPGSVIMFLTGPWILLELILSYRNKK